MSAYDPSDPRNYRRGYKELDAALSHAVATTRQAQAVQRAFYATPAEAAAAKIKAHSDVSLANDAVEHARVVLAATTQGRADLVTARENSNVTQQMELTALIAAGDEHLAALQSCQRS